MPVHLERQVRRLILALLVFGLVGTVVELLALGHYKDSWQSVPLGLMAATLVVIAWHVFTGNAASVRALRVAMLLLLTVGGIGVALHYRGGLEFQVDANPDWPGGSSC